MKNAADERVLRELENQNPAISQAFHILRLRAFSHIALETEMPSFGRWLETERWMESIRGLETTFQIKVCGVALAAIMIAFGLLGITTVSYSADLTFVVQHWKAILLHTGTVSLSVGVILLINWVGSSPLQHIRPPDVKTEEPLQELEALARRTIARLQASYRLQLWTVVAVGLLFVALVAFAMVMVSQERILYATAFGSGSIVMLILTKFKWQPYDKINQARKLANQADVLLTGLTLRMQTIQKIQDPEQKAKAQWQAVSEYLFLSREDPSTTK